MGVTWGGACGAEGARFCGGARAPSARARSGRRGRAGAGNDSRRGADAVIVRVRGREGGEVCRRRPEGQQTATAAARPSLRPGSRPRPPAAMDGPPPPPCPHCGSREAEPGPGLAHGAACVGCGFVLDAAPPLDARPAAWDEEDVGVFVGAGGDAAAAAGEWAWGDGGGGRRGNGGARGGRGAGAADGAA